jgi:predicted transcriptional regulator
MRGDGNSADVRQLLSQRADALSRLLDADRTKNELTEELDVSRSTVDRAVRELESNGLVRREGGTVTATLSGRLAYDSYRRFCAETEHVVEFGDLLAELPPTATISHEMLDDATAYRSEPPATGRPANEITALIAEGTRLRACATAIDDSAAAEQFYRMVTERGGEGAVVYTSSLAEHLRGEYFRTHHEMAATGRFRAYEIDGLPYGLFLIDTDEGVTAAVLVYNDAGAIQGAIFNDTDAAVEWAEERFESLVEAATEFTDDFHLGDVEERRTGEADADGGTNAE